MRRVLTSGEMKGADEAAMEMGLPSLVLMERAALSVIDLIFREKLDLSHVLVVCGTGNNGGDGVAVARLLAERGIGVEVLFPLGTERVSEQLKTQLRVMGHYGIRTVSAYGKGRYSLVVDALFGIGLTRDITGDAAELIGCINDDSAFVLAVDIASGLDGNTGRVCGRAVRADMTVTFAAPKRGHYLGSGRAYTGKLFVTQIGIPVDTEKTKEAAWSIEERDLATLPARDETGNKGTFGKLLVVGGCDEICGAPYFTAAAALRCGIGMVRIFTTEKNRTALSVLLPEALITTFEEGAYNRDILEKAYGWADAVAAGPGLGTSESSLRILKDLLEIDEKPLILDADALNLLAEHPALWQKIGGGCTVTPHAGEMARLTKRTIDAIKADPVDAAAGLAGKYGVTCILKDASTVTAYPDGRVFINPSGCSALATAGSGDVLTGITAALVMMHQKTALPVEAMAVYLHGRAGENAAAKESAGAVTAGSILKAITF